METRTNEMKIVAVANHKGGVGKTTTVAALGPLLAATGRRVLMVDLDPQRSLTGCFLESPPEGGGAYAAFMNPRGVTHGEAIVPGTEFRTPREGLDLMPASPGMTGLESALSGRTSRERILEKALRRLDVGRLYDLVLMDCPPDLYLATVNALVACNELLVPTTAEYLPLKGLKQLEEKCAELAEDLNPGLRIGGIVVTRYNARRNLNVMVYEALRRTYGDTVYGTRIRENVRLAESPQSMLDIASYAPGSNGARDYAALAREMETRFWEG